MKYLILFFMALPAFAGEMCQVETETGLFDVPCILTDGQIEVTTNDGTVYTFPSDEWKVVSRASGVNAKQDLDQLHADLIAARNANKANGRQIEKLATQLDKKVTGKKHRVNVMAGAGPQGRTVKNTGNGVEVSPRIAPVGGIQYGYKVSKNWNVNGTIISGKEKETTGMIGVGKDF